VNAYDPISRIGADNSSSSRLGDISRPGLRHALQWQGKEVTDLRAWLRRLIFHSSNRFVEHPCFVFHVSNLIQRRVAQSATVQYVKRFCTEADPTVEELQASCEKDRRQFLQSVHAFTAQIQGTDSYWNNVRNHVQAAVRSNIYRGRGLPSFFITSSCAEFHHPALSRLVAEALAHEACARRDGTTWAQAFEMEKFRMETDNAYRRRQILRHPQITVRFFELRTKQYIQSILKPVWGIRDFFCRFEFAEARGQVNYASLSSLHACLWPVTLQGFRM